MESTPKVYYIRDTTILTNPRIFSQCGEALVTDLRKLADRSHLDQKNSSRMQFTSMSLA
jgi:hypothetical protein